MFSVGPQLPWPLPALILSGHYPDCLVCKGSELVVLKIDHPFFFNLNHQYRIHMLWTSSMKGDRQFTTFLNTVVQQTERIFSSCPFFWSKGQPDYWQFSFQLKPTATFLLQVVLQMSGHNDIMQCLVRVSDSISEWLLHCHAQEVLLRSESQISENYHKRAFKQSTFSPCVVCFLGFTEKDSI